MNVRRVVPSTLYGLMDTGMEMCKSWSVHAILLIVVLLAKRFPIHSAPRLDWYLCTHCRRPARFQNSLKRRPNAAKIASTNRSHDRTE